MTANLSPKIRSAARLLGNTLHSLIEREQGQDLVEYALLTGFMVVAVWAVIPAEIVPSISGIFSRLISTASVLVP